MAKQHISDEEWVRFRAQPFADVNVPTDWPQDVRPVSIEGIMLLGIGPDNKLYWDGKEVEMRRTVKLEPWQTILALLAALGAFGSGLVEVLTYLGITLGQAPS